MSDDNIIHLAPAKNVPQPNVVAMLEGILERARSGELTDVTVVGVTDKGRTLLACSIRDHCFTLAGALAHMQKHVLSLIP